MRPLTMPQDKSSNPWMKTHLRIEFHCNGAVREYTHWFTTSAVLAADLVYPADLFVLLQPFADDLGLDWDCDLYDLYVDERSGQQKSTPPLLGSEERQKVLGGNLTPDGQVRIDGLDKTQFKWMLRRMAARDWRDVILVKEARGMHKKSAERDQDFWEAMDGMSNLSVSGSDDSEDSPAVDEEELSGTTKGVSKLKLSDRRYRKRQKQK
ncbi:hypothetical protein BJ166DRAFT_497082 [Pestalotiopsis sp. NC0098]|nr:hypothetical protein BJ166DRAFT_497082 [Pestalotiopsis sp. NC0098]